MRLNKMTHVAYIDPDIKADIFFSWKLNVLKVLYTNWSEKKNDVQTVYTQIRLLLKEHSDVGLRFLPFHEVLKCTVICVC